MHDSEASHIGDPILLNESPVKVSTETIVVVDMVESTYTSNLFGWYAVGRDLMRDLRNRIRTIGSKYDLRCMKSTGDGYLLTYGNSSSAELGAIQAVDASLALIQSLSVRNELPTISEERRIHVRIAIHFGQVDVFDNDREGPHVSYAFRLESINRESVRDAINAIPAQEFPLRNYILCSEPVRNILARRGYSAIPFQLGLFRFRGFPDWHEVFLFDNRD